MEPVTMLQGAAAGLSIVSSLFGGKESNAMSAEQKQVLNSQNEMVQDMRSLADSQRGLYDQYSGDIFTKMFEEISKGPDYQGALGRATADVNQAFGAAEERNQRNNFRYGVNPASGAYQNQMSRNGVDRTLAEVSTRNKARREEDDKAWARLLTGANTVQGFMSNAVGAGSAAMGGASSVASGYGNMADRYADSAANGMSAGFEMLNNFANGLDTGGSGGGWIGDDANLYWEE